LPNKISFSLSQGPKSKEDPEKNFLAMKNLDKKIVARDSQWRFDGICLSRW